MANWKIGDWVYVLYLENRVPTIKRRGGAQYEITEGQIVAVGKRSCRVETFDESFVLNQDLELPGKVKAFYSVNDAVNFSKSQTLANTTIK